MAKKNSTVDIWQGVPKDARGRYLEAATDESGFVIASSEILTVTSFPIKSGDEVGTKETVQVSPNGSLVFYASGPSGSHVSISLIRVPGSGGHNHGGATSTTAAVGTNSPSNFTFSGAYPQNIRQVYRAPDVCGIIRQICRNSSNQTVENRIEVMIQGLRPIPQSANLKLKPPTTQHPSPYWAQQVLIDKLVLLSNLYSSKTGKPITITDASLPWGGRFDLNQNWAPPHHEHTEGRQADIRSNDMSVSDRQEFLQAAAQAGLAVLDESNHWHVRT